MNTAKLINQKIAKIPNGEPFTSERFKTLGNWNTVRKNLSRLTENGQIIRIENGLYAKYKIYNGIKYIQTHEPLIKCIEEMNHETVVTAGTMAVNQLGLSTQCQMKEAYYWTGRKKTLQVGNRKITFHHINKKFANKSHPILELLLSAAYNLGKEHFTVESLRLIEKKLGKAVLIEMKPYLPQMPTWVMLVFNTYLKGIQ
jgi:hypothetical protein